MGSNVNAEQQHEYFRFFDLPGELRNRIYDLYVAGDKKVRRRWERTRNECPRRGSIMHGWGCRKCFKTYYSYTPEHKERQKQLRYLTHDLSGLHLERFSGLPEGAYLAHFDYLDQHTMDVARCFHDDHNNPYKRNDDVVMINERGCLCDDLPFLALAARQMLIEMWDLFFPSTIEQPLRFKAKIRNTNFFPFFRSLAMLQKHRLVDVKGYQVSVDFTEQKPWKVDKL
jgi:hypothetical protein